MESWLSLAASFLTAAALISVAGRSLARLADEIAEATGVSRGFLGFLLLSSVTSLPEAVTSLAATVYVQSAGMAFGNVFGSNMVNLALVFVMDLFYEGFEQEGKVLSQLKGQEIPMSLWVILLTSVTLLGTALGLCENLRPYLTWLSPVTLPLLVLYGISIRSVYSAETAITGGGGPPRDAAPKASVKPERSPVGALLSKFLLAALTIGACGLWLTSTCDRIAQVSGMGQTLVGVILLALVTSLPEMTVTLAAVRQGNLGMGLANLLGSNIFNLTILGLCDLASFGKSPFLDPGAVRAMPCALVSVMMVTVLIFGIRDPRWRTVRGGASLSSWCLLGLYLAGAVLTYAAG